MTLNDFAHERRFCSDIRLLLKRGKLAMQPTGSKYRFKPECCLLCYPGASWLGKPCLGHDLGGMKEKLKENWRHFKEGKPGYRFQDRYHRNRHASRGWLSFRIIFNVVVGVALVLAGFFMVVAPGPGWLTVFLGLALLAGEMLLLARFLDRAEVGARKLARLVRDVWESLPTAGKALVVLLILACVATLGYVAYHLAFGS